MVECVDGTLYTGITTDITRRLHEHNNTRKGARYTRSRRPVSLVYWREFSNRSEATSAEIAAKRLSKVQKLEMVARCDHETLDKKNCN